MDEVSFSGMAIVCCGTLSLKLNHSRERSMGSSLLLTLAKNQIRVKSGLDPFIRGKRKEFGSKSLQGWAMVLYLI